MTQTFCQCLNVYNLLLSTQTHLLRFYKRQLFFFQSAVLDFFLTVSCKNVKMDECNGRFYSSSDSVLMKKKIRFKFLKKRLIWYMSGQIHHVTSL